MSQLYGLRLFLEVQAITPELCSQLYGLCFMRDVRSPLSSAVSSMDNAFIETTPQPPSYAVCANFIAQWSWCDVSLTNAVARVLRSTRYCIFRGSRWELPWEYMEASMGVV